MKDFTLTRKRLDEIYGRLHAASKGEWTRAGVTLPGISVVGESDTICERSCDHFSDEYAAQVVADMDFIANAKDDMDLLLQEYSHLMSMLCEARGGHDWEDREPDGFWDVPWKRCSKCRSAMMA